MHSFFLNYSSDIANAKSNMVILQISAFILQLVVNRSVQHYSDIGCFCTGRFRGVEFRNTCALRKENLPNKYIYIHTLRRLPRTQKVKMTGNTTKSMLESMHN